MKDGASSSDGPWRKHKNVSGSILVEEKEMSDNFQLPNKLRGRGLHIRVIPTVCNLKNMLNKLVQVNGDFL